jgi:hypothetical protein
LKGYEQKEHTQVCAKSIQVYSTLNREFFQVIASRKVARYFAVPGIIGQGLVWDLSSPWVYFVKEEVPGHKIPYSDRALREYIRMMVE